MCAVCCIGGLLLSSAAQAADAESPAQTPTSEDDQRSEPAQPAYTREETEPRSPALVGGGVALSLIGTLGVGMAIAGARASDDTCTRDPEVCPEAEFYPKLFGAVGGSLLAGGIFMIIYGDQQVPVQRPVALQVVPWASPHSGGLTLRLTSTSF